MSNLISRSTTFSLLFILACIAGLHATTAEPIGEMVDATLTEMEGLRTRKASTRNPGHIADPEQTICSRPWCQLAASNGELCMDRFAVLRLFKNRDILPGHSADFPVL